MEWVSDNGKWVVKEFVVNKEVSTVIVLDTVNNKSDKVFIEHIKAGQTMLIGALATESYDNYVTYLKIPKYLQNRISKLIKEGAV